MKTLIAFLVLAGSLSAQVPSRFPRKVTGTIAAGQSLSGPINLQGCTVARFNFSTMADSAVLTFQSGEGAAFKEVVDFYNAAVTFPASTGNVDVVVNPGDWYARNYIKVRSGTVGSPVAQTNAVSFEFICKD